MLATKLNKQNSRILINIKNTCQQSNHNSDFLTLKVLQVTTKKFIEQLPYNFIIYYLVIFIVQLPYNITI